MDDLDNMVAQLIENLIDVPTFFWLVFGVTGFIMGCVHGAKSRWMSLFDTLMLAVFSSSLFLIFAVLVYVVQFFAFFAVGLFR